MNTTHSPQSGFMTIQALAVVFVTLTVITAGAALTQMGMQELRMRSAGQQLRLVAQAAQSYGRMQGYVHSLTPGATATAVSTASFEAAGLLPPLPTGAKLSNPWQQEYVIYYYLPPTIAPANPALTVIVLTTGGETLTETQGAAASMAGVGGGVVTHVGTGDILRGIGGTYSIDLAKAPMNIPSPSAGHLGYYVSLDDAAMLADTLYRVAVPGRPELNQMQVDLDMRSHSLVNAKSIHFNATSVQSMDLVTICGTTPEEKLSAEGKVFFYAGAGTGGVADNDVDGIYACRNGTPFILADAGNTSLMRTVRTVNAGTSIDGPVCPAGQHPFIAVSPASLPTGTSPTDTIHTTYKGTGTAADPWVVELARYDVAGNILATDGGTISVIVSCSR